MKRAIFVVVVTLFIAAGAAEKEERIDDTLVLAAQKALPREMPASEVIKALQAGLWNTNRTAFAVSVPTPKASAIVVFLRQKNGTYLAIDASRVESGNFGKLGLAGTTDYDRFETTPVRWLHRDDGWFQVVIRTRAWKSGQRFTVTEPLIIKADGAVLWR